MDIQKGDSFQHYKGKNTIRITEIFWDTFELGGVCYREEFAKFVVLDTDSDMMDKYSYKIGDTGRISLSELRKFYNKVKVNNIRRA